MMGTSFGANSNCFATTGEEPYPASSSGSFGALGDFLVVGSFGGIVPAIKNPFKHMYRATLGEKI
jgi:hypothetical protein